MQKLYHKDLTGAALHWPKPHASTHMMAGADRLPVFEPAAVLPPTAPSGQALFLSADEYPYIYRAAGWKRMLLEGDVAGGVVGPAASTDNAIARWNGAGGDTLQNSGIIVDDANNVSGIGALAGVSATFTGTGTFDKIALTNVVADYEDITSPNRQFGFQSTYVGANDLIDMVWAASIGKNIDWGFYADGGDGLWGEYIYFGATCTPSSSAHIGANLPINIYANLDTGDYIQFKTTSNVPEITTVGDCNLKITASSGTIDFDNEILITTDSYRAYGTGGESTSYVYMSFDSANTAGLIWTSTSDGTSPDLILGAQGAKVIIGQNMNLIPWSTATASLGTTLLGWDSLYLGGVGGAVFPTIGVSWYDNVYRNYLRWVEADGANSTITFPNLTGTVVTTVGANGDINIGAYDLTAVELIATSTIATASGNAWNLATYTAGVVVDTGWVSVTIDGQEYKLLARLEL